MSNDDAGVMEDDNPALTDAQLAAVRPAAAVFSAEELAALQRVAASCSN